MNRDYLRDYGYFLNGEYRDADEHITVLDPATNEEVATVPEAGPEGVDRAIESSLAAQEEWADGDPAHRRRVLTDIAERIREEVDRIAEIETLEEGRPLTESCHQIEAASHYFEYYAGLTDKIEGRQIPLGGGDALDYTRREPYGVTAHVVPWNASFVLAARGFGPALAAGNSVVAKASSKAPASLLELADLAHDAGLPSGVLNVVTGSGSTTGDPLVTDERVEAIEFTGSTATGKHVMREAADHVTPIHLELGGKGSNIVFADADIDGALDSVVATYANAGQICYAPTRIFVQSAVYDEFVERAVERVSALSVGPGIDDPDMGPLVDRQARDTVVEYVDNARENGARVLTGGEIPREEGNFYAPTLIDGVADDAPLSCQEVFGPVFALYEFETASEAVARANDTIYGLSNLVWTNDLSRAHRVAEGLESGTVWINDYPVLSPAAVSGGYKQSGLGRAKGVQAIEAFTQTKNVIVSLVDGE